MCLPNLFIVGAAKAGTSALYEALSAHPEIFFSSVKEPHYFSLAGPPDFNGPGDAESINHKAVWRWADYKNLFRGGIGRRYRGEASVSYLYRPTTAARIRDRCPKAKIIIVLRHPTSRAFSSFVYLRMLGREPADTFLAALADEERRVEARWQPLWHYRRMSQYGSQVKEYLDVFGESQVLVLRHEDWIQDDLATLHRICDFLELNHDLLPSGGVGLRNASGEPQSAALQNWLNSDGWVKQLSRSFVPRRLRRSLRRSLQQANLKRARLEDETFLRITKSFHGDVQVLEDLLGWDLQQWR